MAVETMTCDFAVVGSGIAGLRAALELGRHGETWVLTKDAVAESATQYAQGGIAAALGDDDTFELHEQDTLAAGDGLCEPAAVRVLVEEGPEAIRELLGWGAAFDRVGTRLERTREAAHSRSRILHAHGDSTGREIAETLARQVAANPRIRILAHWAAVGLPRDAKGRVAGVHAFEPDGGTLRPIRCRAVLLACGGLGQVFSDTTNPQVATGDGPALAWEAGAELADMEFVQFHPTALAFPGAPRFLLSEALRGEGAWLRNPAGERFMTTCHPAAELAPRDVVARAIERELRRFEAPATRASRTCFLDATHLPAAELERRFPRIAATLRQYGLELARDWIPVRPAAHYAMGGVWTDLDGRSTVPGLFAAGESACTGVHGANRLASNSLLEGLVFGARAARAMAHQALGDMPEAPDAHAGGESGADLANAIARLRRAMWENAGVLRDAAGLRTLLATLETLPPAPPLPGASPGALPGAWHSMKTTALAIARAALAREESRGAHYREDFPQHDSALARRHSVQSQGRAIRFHAETQSSQREAG